jgi:hypothetical protein
MNILYFILLLLGLLCFVVSAFGWGPNAEPRTPPRVVNLVALGLAFWIIVPLVHAAQALG